MKRAITIVALTVGVVLVSAAPAQAHSYLIASTPVEGDTLTRLPEEFSVTANESLLDLVGDGTGFGMQIVDATGRFYGDGCLTIGVSSLSTSAALGEAGSYELVWQIVSADGHPVSGTIPFDWAPDADFVPSESYAAPPLCEAEGELPEPVEVVEETDYSSALWIGGAALAVLLAVGVTVFLTRRRS